jgi:hypothetical protein
MVMDFPYGDAEIQAAITQPWLHLRRIEQDANSNCAGRASTRQSSAGDRDPVIGRDATVVAFIGRAQVYFNPRIPCCEL